MFVRPGFQTASLLTTAKRWAHPKCPPADEGINKMWSLRTMEYYSASKRKEILAPAATWINLEGTRLSEISQAPKGNIAVIPLL